MHPMNFLQIQIIKMLIHFTGSRTLYYSEIHIPMFLYFSTSVLGTLDLLENYFETNLGIIFPLNSESLFLKSACPDFLHVVWVTFVSRLKGNYKQNSNSWQWNESIKNKHVQLFFHFLMVSLWIWKLPWNHKAFASVRLTHTVNSHTDESLIPVQLQIYQESTNFSSKTWQTLCGLVSTASKFPEMTLDCMHWNRHTNLRRNAFLSFFLLVIQQTSLWNL